MTTPLPIANEKSNEGEEEAPVKLSAVAEGLRPNETYYDRVAGQDQNVKTPELLTGEAVSFSTPLADPGILGEPGVSFVHSSSAVMFGELNPENAKTEYFFEYAPEHEPGEGTLVKCSKGVRKENCEDVATTPTQQSAAYGTIDTTLEATGLQPSTVYHYRLFAESENDGQSEKRSSKGEDQQEGSFTTAPAPVPQAFTGSASMIGATSAVVSGTVNPDGQPATYTFQLGIYNGADTQYGTVLSAPAGAGVLPIEESLALTGLQPGTTYAYKITIRSGYGSAEGAAMTFTTAGLPSVLVVPGVLAQLPIPNIAFPKPVGLTTTKALLTNAQKLAKALGACKKKSKKQRPACEKRARKQYSKSKQANNRKKG